MSDAAREWSKFGRYALLQKIGSGGMAEIYRGKTFGAAGFEKEFAIKLILPSLVDDTEFVEMFINEAKIAVSLYHANIVQVFDLGEIDNQYFIAMEYVYGKDLLDVLARCAEMNIKIPLNLVLFIAMEMLKGLDFAHRAKDPFGEDLNIIHRDVSPSNILLSYTGDVKVGDFGVAKAAVQRTLTESGTLKGKVGYMSPEQVMGEAIDSRSDVFSAAIVLFEALSMSRLFVGNSDLDVMLKVRDADIEPNLKRAGPFPGDLTEIIRKGLAKHREDRFQTAGELYQALVDFCFQHAIKVTGSDLSNFMRRLFAKEIEEEKSQRRSEPGGEAIGRESVEATPPEVGSQKVDSPLAREETALALGEDDTDAALAEDSERESKTDEKKYRYRDHSGLIFGPMGPATLADLLRVRRPRPDDHLSIAEGLWTRLDEVEDLQEVLDPKPRRSPKKATSPGATEKAKTPLETNVIRDVRRAIAQMEEESLARHDDRDPSLTFSLPDEKNHGLGNSSTDLAPPPVMKKVKGEPSSPAYQTAPSMFTNLDFTDSNFKELKEQYASYEGDLGDTYFARILARLHLAKCTGRLFVTDSEAEKSIFFRNGEPIFVHSNRKSELLGNFLLERDLITEAQLSEALERLSEWGGRLGDALVAIGAIPAHSIFEYLSAQMSEKLLEIFTWEGGYYGYYENQEPDTQGYSLDLDTYEVIVEGCRERMDLERVRKAYQSRSFVSIFPNDPKPFSIDLLGLRARELRVYHQLQAGETLRSLLGKFEHELHETVYRTIFLLHQVEIISFEVTEKVDLPSLRFPQQAE